MEGSKALEVGRKLQPTGQIWLTAYFFFWHIFIKSNFFKTKKIIRRAAFLQISFTSDNRRQLDSHVSFIQHVALVEAYKEKLASWSYSWKRNFMKLLKGCQVPPGVLRPYFENHCSKLYCFSVRDYMAIESVLDQDILNRDFAGGPVVKTRHFQCRGHRFDPWSGN